MIVEAGGRGRGEVGQRGRCGGVLRALLRSKKDNLPLLCRETGFGAELRPPLGAEGAIAETATKDAAETALSVESQDGANPSLVLSRHRCQYRQIQTGALSSGGGCVAAVIGGASSSLCIPCAR